MVKVELSFPQATLEKQLCVQSHVSLSAVGTSYVIKHHVQGLEIYSAAYVYHGNSAGSTIPIELDTWGA